MNWKLSKSAPRVRKYISQLSSIAWLSVKFPCSYASTPITCSLCNFLKLVIGTFWLSNSLICMLPQPLADAYGLLMHRNGQWEWTLAPGVSPSPRYQHAAVSNKSTSGVHICQFVVKFFCLCL